MHSSHHAPHGIENPCHADRSGPRFHATPAKLIARCFLIAVAALTNLEIVTAKEPPIAEHRDIVYAVVGDRALKLDLIVPSSTSEKPPLVVWIHGGGWRGGSKDRVPIRALTASGYALASIEYRFTEQAIFPAQIHDCKAAIRWLRKHADHYQVDASWLAVAGSSAGGHLALLMGTSGGVELLEGTIGGELSQSSTVQAVVDFYGPSDFILRRRTQPDRALTEKSGSFALLGGLKHGEIDPRLERLASPVTHVDPGDPPLLVFHGTEDEVVLMDQSERIVDAYANAALNATLIRIENAGHGGDKFFGREQIDLIRKFLDEHRPH